MVLQRVLEKSLRSLQEHWCHCRNMKYLREAQINSRLSNISLHWLQSNSLYPIRHDKWLDFLKATNEIPWDTRLKTLGTPISAQELEESSIQPESSWKESWYPLFYWTIRPTFHKHLKRSLPWAIGMWEGPWFCCLKLSGYQDYLTRNKVRFPWSGLNAGSSFISHFEGMSESSVETLEKTLVPRLIWTGRQHLLTPREARGVQCFKGDEAWLFLKIDRNQKIFLETRKGCLVSNLTTRSICIILSSLI